MTLPEPVTSRSKVPCQEESRKALVSGHIARIPCAGDALVAKKFRAAAVQMGKLACTDAQTLPGLTHMSKKAIAELRMRVEIAGVR